MSTAWLDVRCSRDELRRHQYERLRTEVERCYECVSHYRKRFDEIGLKPSDIRSLDDLHLIPFTEKGDLRALRPFGLLAVHREQVARFAGSSGTTGHPTVIGFTAGDLRSLRQQMGRQLEMFGMRQDDLVYQGHGYGLFTGGMAVEAGAEALGASLFPAGSGRAAAAVHWLRDLQPTAIVCTPSFLHYLIAQAVTAGLEPRRDWERLRVGAFGGEPASPAARARALSMLPERFEYHELYGSSELGGPTVAGSCHVSREFAELHVHADQYIVEIVDPATGQVREPGEPGELVFTTLNREATPLLRWRTRDLVMASSRTWDCSCGRGAFPRVSSIIGRLDDMLKVRGTIVFPSQIEESLKGIPELGEGWQIAIDEPANALQRLLVQCEVDERLLRDDAAAKVVTAKVIAEVSGRLGISPVVELCSFGSLPRYEGKANRVIDRRAPVEQRAPNDLEGEPRLKPKG